MRTRKMLSVSALCAVLALAVTACFNPPFGLNKEPAEAQQYTADGRPLIRLQIGLGNAEGKSLSPELAEKYFNYFEVIFAENNGAPINSDTPIYRAAGFTNQSVKISVPEGLYDNTANTAIMMAGSRNLTTGESTLLATGVIVDHVGGPGSEPAAKIGSQTTRVIFKLTALTAEIKAAPDSAFKIPASPNNYGKTRIDGVERVYFSINTSGSNSGVTNAELTLTGWEGGTPTGNNTQRFIQLVHTAGEKFGLSGIGLQTDDGDDPLSSTANVEWKIDNAVGPLGTDPIKIKFTSSSGLDVSGMAWLPIRVPVKAFFDIPGAQVWHVGSGILWDKLDAGAGSAGAGIVILHGNKMYNPGLGTGQIWKFERTLDLGEVAGTSLAGWWTFAGDTYTLLGDATLNDQRMVRVVGATTTRNIVVADGKEVNVLLDDMEISPASAIIPFKVGTGSKAIVYLRDGTDNILTGYGDSAALDNTAGTLVIKGNTGTIAAKGGANGGAGIGGAVGAAGGVITIDGGIVLAEGVGGGAGIGGGGGSGTGGVGSTGAITINGGTVIAKGSMNGSYGSAGIGGGAGATTGGDGSSGSITINGGVVIAEGGDDGAGIGGGAGGTTNGTGGTITLNGGTVYASATGVNGKGIGAAGSGTNSNISIGATKPVIFASSADTGLTEDLTNAILVGPSLTWGTTLTFSFPSLPTSNSLVITAQGNIIVPVGATFTIPPYIAFTHGTTNQTLENKGTLVIDGTLALFGSGSVLDNSTGKVLQSGTYNNNGGSPENGDWTVIP